MTVPQTHNTLFNCYITCQAGVYPFR